jgi:hypothetical protein
MDATRFLILNLHENVKLRFIGRTLKMYIRRPVKCSPRKKLVENASWEPRRGLRRWGSVSDVLKMAIMLDVSRTLLRTIVKEDFKLKPHKQPQPRLRKQQESTSLLATLVMILYFLKRHYFCCKRPKTNRTTEFILFHWEMFHNQHSNRKTQILPSI